MEKKGKNIEALDEMPHKAKEETENFLNRWINDSTKGWPVQSPHLAKDYKKNFSIPFAIGVYPFLIGLHL